VKTINKNKTRSHRIYSEASILTYLSHDKILPLKGFFETDNFFYFVTPLYSGGDLMKAFCEGREFSERDSLAIVHQVLDAVAYCHNHGIVHRDIKPENIMFKSDLPLEVVLIDFGIAKKVTCRARGQMEMHSLVGTPQYAAPEIVNKKLPYSEKCDSWSVGVVLHTLLLGWNPFEGQGLNETYELIRTQEVKCTSHEWRDISNNTITLVRSLLCKEPEVRLSARSALHETFYFGSRGNS